MNTSPKSLINPKPSDYLLCMGTPISLSAAIPDTCLSPQVLFCQLSRLISMLVFSFSPGHWNQPPLCLTFSWGRSFHKLPHGPNCPLLYYDAEVWHRLEGRQKMSWFWVHAAPDRDRKWDKRALCVSRFTNTISCLGLARQQTNQSSEAVW